MYGICRMVCILVKSHLIYMITLIIHACFTSFIEFFSVVRLEVKESQTKVLWILQKYDNFADITDVNLSEVIGNLDDYVISELREQFRIKCRIYRHKCCKTRLLNVF